MKEDKLFPMMLPYEVSAIERILLNEKEVSVVEWGSGYSTIYFTKFLKKNNVPYTWVSVEDNKEWYEYVKEKVKDDPHTEVFFETELDSYIKRPAKIIKKFDVALVDGRRDWRGQCVDEANKIASTVLLHDAQRKSYLPFAKGKFLAGRLLKIGPNRPFSRFIQLSRFQIHERLWKAKQILTKYVRN